MFSETVDKIVRRTDRKDFQTDIIAFLNSVTSAIINEALYDASLVEDLITVSQSGQPRVNTFVWKRPRYLKNILAVKYNDGWDNEDSYARNILPSSKMVGYSKYYYQSGDGIVFHDAGGLPETIAIAYYTAPRSLTYYPIGQRPAVFDELTQTWSYLKDGVYVPSLDSEEAETQAKALVTNWVLERHNECVCSGTANKIFTMLQDPRNTIEYSNYNNLLGALKNAETSLSVK